MFFVLGFLAVGGAVYTAERLAPFALGAIVLAAILYPVAVVLDWWGNVSGIGDFTVWSFQQLSGANTPAQITPGDCDDPTAWVFVGFILALANFVIGGAAIIGMLISPVILAVNGVRTLVSKDRHYVKIGLTFMAVSLGLLITAGLIMRLMSVLWTSLVCANG